MFGQQVLAPAFGLEVSAFIPPLASRRSGGATISESAGRRGEVRAQLDE